MSYLWYSKKQSWSLMLSNDAENKGTLIYSSLQGFVKYLKRALVQRLNSGLQLTSRVSETYQKVLV